MKQSDKLFIKIGDKMPVQREIEEFYGLKKGDILIPTNKRIISNARKISMWIEVNENLKKYHTPKWCDVARKYPGRSGKGMNHASVIRNVESISDIMQVDKKFRNEIYAIQIKIFGKIKFK